MLGLATVLTTRLGYLQPSPRRVAFRFATVLVIVSWCLSSAWVSTFGAERLTPERLWELQRVGDVAISPDGRQIAYLVTKYSLEDNYGSTSLMLQTLPTDLPGQAVVDGRRTGDTNGNDSARRPLSQQPTAIGFDTPLRTSPAQALLSEVRGLQSLSWIARPEGPQLLYVAPDVAPSNGANTTGDAPSGEATADSAPAQRASPKLGCSPPAVVDRSN